MLAMDFYASAAAVAAGAPAAPRVRAAVSSVADRLRRERSR